MIPITLRAGFVLKVDRVPVPSGQTELRLLRLFRLGAL